VLSELEGLTGFALTWRPKATPSGRFWWVLGRSEPRTNGTESGSWPTATAKDEASSGAAAYSTESGQHPGTTLTDAANGLWATASATDYKGSVQGETLEGRRGMARGVRLPEQIARFGPPALEKRSTSGKSPDWPTLDVGAVTGGRSARGQSKPGRQSTLAATGQRGTLNSRWVAQLMGYPSDWLDVGTERLSKLWATAWSRKSSRPSGGRS